MTEQPKIHSIKRVIDEAKDARTFVFYGQLDSSPGQFVNVWIPGVDEKPYSISYQDDEKFAITCFAVGNFSKSFNGMKEGDKIGIRGPYGTRFTTSGIRNAVLVGGGCGTAPLAFLANELRKRKVNVDFIMGARSNEFLMYHERMVSAGVNVHIATDDGSAGFKGFSTELLDRLLAGKAKDADMIYACGPEIMMKKVIDIADRHGRRCELSLERYMKCGFGICGQCCVDNLGIRVCKEGPVMGKEIVKHIFEFNKYKRDSSGKKVPFYGSCN
ncbi:dihydroorotate dehydrogenase electron transfer subunit [Candidatus Woesearchaeota archaeon CG10_big_fil_rev_8_21_14_0_10_44_13]|nr:MAG: dihydroorotate dehydrogenase electron transfer subunit [Candidatus Woesearchaeota archaeon CG10_big_fil_rev_8_21_14_0_10_44_13]